MDAYFELPGIGELVLEHSFYTLDGEPILFVCKDGEGRRYLCSCYQMGRNWVIGQTEETALLEMMEDQITIREVFQLHCASKWTASWDGTDVTFGTDVPDEVLPREGALLELAREKTGQYRETLRLSRRQKLPERASRLETAPPSFLAQAVCFLQHEKLVAKFKLPEGTGDYTNFSVVLPPNILSADILSEHILIRHTASEEMERHTAPEEAERHTARLSVSFAVAA